MFAVEFHRRPFQSSGVAFPSQYLCAIDQRRLAAPERGRSFFDLTVLGEAYWPGEEEPVIRDWNPLW